MNAAAVLCELKASHASFTVRDNIVLRPISSHDVTQGYVDGLNDADVRRHLGATKTTRQSVETVTSYVDFNEKSADAVLFGVFVDTQLCGTIRIHDINFETGTAVVGIALFDKTTWGKGIGRAVLMEACRIGQNSLGLGVLSAIIQPMNEASKRIFGVSGFVQDKRRPDLWVHRLNKDSDSVSNPSTVLELGRH